jgi:hypothetical protein
MKSSKSVFAKWTATVSQTIRSVSDSSRALEISGVLRLVEDDTAALRAFVRYTKGFR